MCNHTCIILLLIIYRVVQHHISQVYGVLLGIEKKRMFLKKRKEEEYEKERERALSVACPKRNQLSYILLLKSELT